VAELGHGATKDFEIRILKFIQNSKIEIKN